MKYPFYFRRIIVFLGEIPWALPLVMIVKSSGAIIALWWGVSLTRWWVILIVALILLDIAILLVFFVSYRIRRINRTIKSLLHLSILYIETILVFSVLYFWIGILSYDQAMSGVINLWQKNETIEAHEIIIGNIGLNIVDYFHFSVVTMTTLGYGDMLPVKWYAKLIVDLQVLAGLSILVIGIGKHFNKQG